MAGKMGRSIESGSDPRSRQMIRILIYVPDGMQVGRQNPAYTFALFILKLWQKY